MILRFKLCSIAGATALLSTPTDAFTPTTFQRTIIASRTRASAIPPSATRTTTTARPASLNPDWDNDDFLSSLGGGKEDMDQANEKYFKQAEGRRAMDEWRAKKFAEQSSPPPTQQQSSPTQQEGRPAGPSPEFFKKIGLTGDQQPQTTGQHPPPQQTQPPPQMVTPPQPQQMMQPPPPPPQQQPQQQQFFDQNGKPVSMPMVYDQNGNLVPFNPQQMQQEPTQPSQPPIAPMPPQINPESAVYEPPLPPKTKGTDIPRPAGYNPDAWAMSNTADVYFAQLKQDSKVRKIARMSGDTETANKVFEDESVKKIGESWNQNPYTKEQNMAEARAQIEGAVRLQTQEDEPPRASSGISYRDKLEMMKAKRGGAPTKFVKPTDAASAAASSPPKVEQPVAAAPPKLDQPKVGTTAPPKEEQPKVGVTVPPKVGQPMASPMASTPPKAAAAVPVGSMEEDRLRGKVRTLQGLLLKHRGGPGFGAGRLKAPEAQRLEDTLEEVRGILRSEVGIADGKPAAVAQPVAVVPDAPAEPKPAAPQPITTAVPPPPPRAMPAVPAPAQAATMVSQSAAATSQSSAGPLDPLAGSVACVEAALRLYKESSPADKEVMMIPLREALLAAAAASNKHIAESELSAQRAAMDAGPPPVVAAPAQPMMGFPTTYAVTKPEEESVQSAGSNPAADQEENEKKLEDVYNALVQAGGEGGKLGLKNISGDEANDLADKLVAMRGVLLDELNSGS
mmetsp:Transcript_40536/g.86319  ORF Transcript_40536/g.86319 Transcript_40536/m.86319 type:complete len:735 (+) Transcript_40536:163-2367(+)